MDKVIPFKQPKEHEDGRTPLVVHDPTTTIVERIEMTPEMRKAFENAGYDVKDNK